MTKRIQHDTYAVLAWVLLSILIIVTVVCVRNLESLAWFAATSGSMHATAVYFMQLLLGIGEQFSVLGAGIIILAAAGISCNVVLMGLLVRQRGVSALMVRTAPTKPGVLGMGMAVFGIGCAACGTALVVSFLSVLGISGLLLWLPLHGIEFGLLGIGLLAYSAFRLRRALQQPFVC